MSESNTDVITGYYVSVLNRTPSASEVTGWANLVSQGALTLAQVQSDIINSTEALLIDTPIIEMYQADLGRAPDQAGLMYWVTADESGSLTLAQVSSAIASSAESQSYYGITDNVATVASVTQMYANILGRSPEDGAVAYWLGTGMTEAEIQQSIETSFEAMVRANPAVITFLTSVAQGNPSSYVGSLYGATFELTTGTDTFVGGTGNDTFSANGLTTPTWTAGDSITGGSATNIFNVTQTAPIVLPSGATVTNVQAANLTSGGTVNIDTTPWTGLTALNILASTGSDAVTAAGTTAVSVVDTLGAVTVTGGSTVAVATDTSSAVTVHGLKGSTTAVTVTGGGPITIDETATGGGGGASSLAAVTLSGNGSADTIASNALASLVLINDTGSVAITDATAAHPLAVTLANVIGETVTDATAGSIALTATIKSDITLTGIAATALTVAGAGALALRLAPSGTAITSVDGSAGTGSLTLDLGAPITTVMTLKGGSGVNTLGLVDTTLGATPLATINAATGFQTLVFSGASATVDQSAITNAAITTLQFDTTGAVTVTNTVPTENYSIVEAAAVTLAAASGALNVSLDGTSTAAATANGITVTGTTTLNLASNGSAVADNTPGNIILNDGSTLNVAGSHALTLTVFDATPPGTFGETINAGNFTGKLTLDDQFATDKQVITTGSGGSALSLGAGIDSVTLGTGADKLTFLSGSSKISGPDTVTNFNAAGDTFALGAVPTAVDVFSGASTGVLLTDLNAAAGNAFVPGDVAAVTLTGSSADAGTYLVKTAAAAATSTDLAIHLVGLQGSISTQNFA